MSFVTFFQKTFFFFPSVPFLQRFVFYANQLYKTSPKICLIPFSILTDFNKAWIAWPFHMWLRPSHSVGLLRYLSFSGNHKFGILHQTLQLAKVILYVSPKLNLTTFWTPQQIISLWICRILFSCVISSSF